jgi:transcription initiation factor IIE alpha subunit
MMNVYRCENCGSLFIVNGLDPRVQSGDYGMLPDAFCPLCNANLQETDSSDASKDDAVFFAETAEKIMELIGEEDSKRFFNLIVEQIQFCLREGWGYA